MKLMNEKKIRELVKDLRNVIAGVKELGSDIVNFKNVPVENLEVIAEALEKQLPKKVDAREEYRDFHGRLLHYKGFCPELEMIKITKNPNGDTRTAPKGITFKQFQLANDMHIQDVQNVMWELSKMIDRAGNLHDCTKKSQEILFYRNFVDTQENKLNFTEGEWYQMHTKAERHHLISNCPDDVNLIDVLEMIADCTCAGLARSGEIRDLEINSEILERAVKNTAILIKSMIEVVE